jgi:hypothetical protein
MSATRIVVFAATLLGLLMALAGCGTAGGGDDIASAGGPRSSTKASNEQASDEDKAFKFVDCMREHGIDLPDPEPNGKGGFKFGLAESGVDLSSKTFQDAFGACRDLAPFGERLKNNPELMDQLRQLAKCMREHGVDMPDPDPNGGLADMAGIDRDSPEFRQALEACKDKVPGGSR